MSKVLMMNPLEKLKKIRSKSWEELRTRGEQAFSAKSEQIGLSGKLPSDAEFFRLLDGQFFGSGEITPEKLFEKFYENGEAAFFPAFRETGATLEAFRKIFGERSARFFIEKAENIVGGKFDLLGYQNLDFGAKPDWHFEPISKKRSPRKHWKQFDELDTSETGDKKIVWELNRHQHFFTLGVAFWLTENEKFAACFAAHLEDWMNANPPGIGINWFSSLEIAFRAMSWIWAFHFFKDSPHFAPELLKKALKFLYLHGRHIEKYLSTYYSPNTHLTGEALGLYYLGTQLPFFNRAAHWRALGEDILFGELDRQILADGVYFEQTTWYQRYTADFYAHFLILKTLCGKERTDEKTARKLETKIQSLLDFLMYATRPDGSMPLIGDDDGGRMLPLTNAQSDDFRGTLAIGATLFGRGDYKFAAGKLSEETIWLFGREGIRAFETQPQHAPLKKSTGFENGGYFIMRDGWATTDNYLLIDCGEVGALSGGHAHADTLSIDFAVQGKTLLVDSGTYGYHESREIRDYFRSTTAHNALTIDGESSSSAGDKFSWKSRAKARVHSWISEDRFDFFEGSHDGFEKIGAKSGRSVLFLKNDYFIMRDCAETPGEHDYALNFHFDEGIAPAIEKAANGSSCVGEAASQTSGGWRIFTFGDNGGWQREEGFISKNYGEKRRAPFLRFASRDKGTQEFFTFFLPSEKGFAKPEIFETELAGGRSFVVKYRNYTDFFIYTDADGQTAHAGLFSTDFGFFWARQAAGESVPEEFVMIGGTHFALSEREIINHPHRLQFAAARRLGNKLNVRTSESVFSVSIPQGKPSTRILK